MKVLIVIPDLPENLDNIKGGVQSALSNLLKGFASIDANIRVVTFCRSIEKEYIVNYSDTIKIVYCTESPKMHLYNYITKSAFDVKRHIREYQPDLVHFGMGGMCLLARIFGLYKITTIVTIHGISFLEARIIKSYREKLVIYTNEFIEKLLSPKNIIHISKYSKKIKGNSKNLQYAIIPNAIKPIYFDIELKHTTENRLLYVGAIDERKNILLLLQCMYSLIQKGKLFTLEILGDFLTKGYENEIHEYVRSHQLSPYIKFYGWVSQATVIEVLGKADILVVCSKQETLPMVIAEAMAAGKVVVSSDVGGIPEMITDEEDGFLFNLGSPEKLTEILGVLYNNNTLIQLILKNAKKRAAVTYNCEKVARKTIAFYKELSEQVKVKSKFTLYEKFSIMQWGIGFAKANMNEIIRNKKYDLHIKWLPINGNVLSIADPFLIKTPEGNFNVIYENFSMAIPGNYGKIDLTLLDKDFKPLSNKRLLDTNSHLSYPFVFNEDGKTYVIPEAHKSNKVTAYEYDFENNSLVNEKLLIDNLPLIDSTILKFNDKYWLFGTLGENNNDHRKLYIYYSDSLFGKYRPHSKNPVKNSLDASRPAGNFIIVDGQLYRPSQNCSIFYGRSITINKILTLTENDFLEEPYMDIESQKKSFYNVGIHTINSIDDIIVVDGIRLVFMPWAKIYFSIQKIFQKKINSYF